MVVKQVAPYVFVVTTRKPRRPRRPRQQISDFGVSGFGDCQGPILTREAYDAFLRAKARKGRQP